MKNIKTLTLKNFQSWKNSTIKFTKGLNIIVGNSDSGKSAIFRAIDSIFTGKFFPDYVRKQEKESMVKLEFDDNSIFVREKNKTKQLAEANGIKFERIGKEIPQEYFDCLGKTNISVGEKEIPVCLRNQDDSYFFINSSDYEKSKIIGSVCGIDIVDKIMESINKDIRENNSKIKFLSEQMQKTKEVRDEAKNKYEHRKINYDILFKNLAKIQKDYDKLCVLETIKDKLIFSKNELKQLLLKKEAIQFIIKESEFDNIDNNILLLERLSRYWTNLMEIQNNIDLLSIKYNHVDIFVKNAPNFDFLTNLVEICDKKNQFVKTKN